MTCHLNYEKNNFAICKYIYIVLFKIIQSKKIEGGTESVKQLRSGLRGQSPEPWLQSQI